MRKNFLKAYAPEAIREMPPASYIQAVHQQQQTASDRSYSNEERSSATATTKAINSENLLSVDGELESAFDKFVQMASNAGFRKPDGEIGKGGDAIAALEHSVNDQLLQKCPGTNRRWGKNVLHSVENSLFFVQQVQLSFLKKLA